MCAVEQEERKAEPLVLQREWRKDCKEEGVRKNLSSGIRLLTQTSFVGWRIDVRRGKGVK
jgi:hypothetical protein